MGRKNEIEGQLNFMDMLMVEPVVEHEQQEQSRQEPLQQKQLQQEQSHQKQSQQEPLQRRQLEQEPKVKRDKKDKKEKGAVKAPMPGAFSECSSCWCLTCEHSTVGGSVPRPFVENSRSCPSCELCVSDGKADVCVIGSADEGCRYRAEKEGLL